MEGLNQNFSNVHFNGAGNDFWGGIFWLNAKSLWLWSEALIKIYKNGVSTAGEKLCTKLVRGIYYNSQRGNRIRPLDTYTLDLLKATNSNYNGLTINGGLYTACTGDNKYWIFWHITYTQSGTVSHIVAGTKLKYTENIWSGEFAHSLEYFDNKTPLGYIRDSYGGIGFVWGELSGSNNLIAFLNQGGTINSWFTYISPWSTIITVPTRAQTLRTFNQTGNSAINTMWNLIVQWTIGLSNNLNQTDKDSLMGNQQGNSTIFSSNINNADINNQAKEYSEKLCKGKRETMSDNMVLTQTTKSTLCYKGVGQYSLEIDINQAQEELYKNKTIIMKNGHIILTWNMENDSAPLDLFIDEGNLYLPISTINSNQTYFDIQGYPTINNGTSKGLFIKGNIIINGLLIGGTPGSEWSIMNKTHVQGKFFSLNTPFEPTNNRERQIDALLGGTGYDEYINLQNLFKRECNLGTGTDGTVCGYGTDISRVPLVIIDNAFPSRLLK